MRRPGPRLTAPRAADAPPTLSPWPIHTPLLRAPADAPWQRWFSALGTAVNELLATGGGGGGGGGDADTLDGLDSTAFMRKPMPLADLPRHHLTHEPGGVDALQLTAASRLLGRGDSGAGAVQELTLGTGLALSGTTLSATGSALPGAHHTTHEPGGADPLAVDAAAATGSLRTLGTGANQAAPGNDARFSAPSVPTAHHLTHEPGGTDPLAVDAAAATGSLRTLGTGATQAAPGNDARFTAAPQLHKTTHQTGGSDVVDVKLLGGYPGGTTSFLRADGTFAAPATGVPGAHHATHEPGGSDALLNAAWTTVANVFTADQTIAKSGPVLSLTDIGQAVDTKLWKLWAGGSFFVQACSDAGAPLTQPLRLQRDGSVSVGNALTVAGLLTANGFGTHTVTGGGAGPQVLHLANPISGPAARAYLRLQAGSVSGYLQVVSEGWLSVEDLPASALALEATASGGLSLSALHAAGAIRFYSGGATERVTLGANGHLGINTPPDTPQAGRVTILAPTEYGLYAETRTAGQVAVYGLHTVNSSGGYAAIFYNSGSGAGLALTNTGAWVAVSDQRLKRDIRPLDGLAGLRALQPRDFLWATHATSDRPGQRQFGFVAHEVAAVFPDLTAPMPDGLLGVTYTGLIAPLVQGWQDHDRRLAALEAAHTEPHAQ